MQLPTHDLLFVKINCPYAVHCYVQSSHVNFYAPLPNSIICLISMYKVPIIHICTVHTHMIHEMDDFKETYRRQYRNNCQERPVDG